MTVDDIQRLVVRYLEAWGHHDVEQLRQMLDDSCITHQLATGEKRPVAFEVEACEIWHRSFDDVQISIEQVVAQDDRVAVYWLLKSTHAREFMGIEATGKRVNVPGMEISRIANGKIVEIWRLSDTMSLMQQLEAV